MTNKQEIEAIYHQASEIKRGREMLIREMAEIDRWTQMREKELAKDIAKLEIKMALRELEESK